MTISRTAEGWYEARQTGMDWEPFQTRDCKANLNMKNVKIQTFAVMGQSSKLKNQDLVSRLASFRPEAVRA